MAKTPSTPTLKDFLETHDAEKTSFDEVELLKFDRDQLYSVTINSYHEFDGKFGPSVAINYTNAEGTFKAYLGGFEVAHFVKFIEAQELPTLVNLARTLVESQANEGRSFNRLTIAKA